MKHHIRIVVRFILLSLIILVTLSVNIRPSQACSTVQASGETSPVVTIKNLVDKADLILEGTVLATTPYFGGGENYVYVKVDRYFKADNGIRADKTGIYLQFYCGSGLAIKSGQHGLFLGVTSVSNTGSVEATSFIVENFTSEITTSVIEVVGHVPTLPQTGSVIPDLVAIFEADGLNTPGVPFIQTTTIISFISEFFFIAN